MEPRKRHAKSERTRAAIVAAAKDVFRTTSFHDAKITDIAAHANLAHGSFYTHFDSKEEIFLAVLDEVVAEGFIATSVRRELGDRPSPAQQIEAANERYFEFFQRNARVFASMEALAPANPLIEARRHDAVLAYTYRTAAAIRRWQAESDVVPSASLEGLAYCLSAMVERIAQFRYMLHETIPDDALRALTSVWIAAIGIDDEPGATSASGDPVPQHRERRQLP